MTSTGSSSTAAALAPAMLDMRNVRKVYRAGLVETEALAGATLTVNRGEFLAIMGPSGSGKTTFLSVAGLLDSFQAGEYLLDGEDVRRLSDARLSRLRNQKIGFIFQSFNLIPDLDVFDNVDVPLRYRGMPVFQVHLVGLALALLWAASLLATLIPALRAARVPPSVAGRSL